jgi:hypothetical protein
MPVKITLYAEHIAVGTDVVNYALKLGAALGEYVETDPPIKTQNGAGRSQSVDRRTLHDRGFRGQGTLKEAAYETLRSEMGSSAFSRGDAIAALVSNDWDQQQAQSAVHGLIKTGHIA